MNKIGLSLTINKCINHFESIPYFLLFETLENAKLEIINILVSHYKKLHINYPHDLNDFEYEIFSQNDFDTIFTDLEIELIYNYIHSSLLKKKYILNNICFGTITPVFKFTKND